MRSLFNFFYQNSSFLLFTGLQVIALTLFFNYNQYHRSSFINSSNQMIGGSMALKSNMTQYFSLKKVNEQLKNENALLRSNQLQSYYKVNSDQVKVKDTIYQQQYTYTPAKVINSTKNKADNYLTLNIGENSGVQKDMAVIAHKGIIGHVTNVSQRYATVLSAISSKSLIPVVAKNTRHFGILNWRHDRNPSYAYIDDIARDAPLRKGEAIITRGSSKIFPAGITVGYISSIEIPDGEEFQKIKVKLSVDFGSVYQVYVVSNKFKLEQVNLENETQENGK